MNRLYLPGACVLLGALALYSLFLGVHEMTLLGIFAAEERQTQILLVSRVPLLVAILTAGMSMSVVGLIMQQLARNQFVTPSTAGMVEAASLGILVAILFFGAASVMQKMLIAATTGAKNWVYRAVQSRRSPSGKLAWPKRPATKNAIM